MRLEARWASTPLSPTTWIGIGTDPASIGFAETAEAHFAYASAARDYPRVLSVANRIGLANKLQTVATILALRMSRAQGWRDARDVINEAGAFAFAWGPLPIGLVTAESIEWVDAALDDMRGETTTELVLIDLLRLIEGVRP